MELVDQHNCFIWANQFRLLILLPDRGAADLVALEYRRRCVKHCHPHSALIETLHLRRARATIVGLPRLPELLSRYSIRSA